MKALKTALLEVYGLFVEDGTYALDILIWVVLAAVLFPREPNAAAIWSGPVFFLGLAALLAWNVIRTARKKRQS